MRRRYPKLENIKFLLCEQVRPEVGGKLTVIGLFSGDEIVFPLEKQKYFPVIIQLVTFVFVLKDGAGEFSAKFILRDPNGKEIHSMSLEPQKLESGKSRTVGMQLANVKFPTAGIYTATLQFEKKQYEFPFEVSAVALADNHSDS